MRQLIRIISRGRIGELARVFLLGALTLPLASCGIIQGVSNLISAPFHILNFVHTSIFGCSKQRLAIIAGYYGVPGDARLIIDSKEVLNNHTDGLASKVTYYYNWPESYGIAYATDGAKEETRAAEFLPATDSDHEFIIKLPPVSLILSDGKIQRYVPVLNLRKTEYCSTLGHDSEANFINPFFDFREGFGGLCPGKRANCLMKIE